MIYYSNMDYKKAKKVSVLIPCYNEEETLPILYKELSMVMNNLKSYLWEVLFIDDGSNDNTINIINNMRHYDSQINYISLSRNFGKENAMLAGFDYVQGDCVIIIYADLQDPPRLFPKMLEYWEMGYQDVYAKRKNRGKESNFRKCLSMMFYKILDSSSRIEMLQNVGDFRLLDRQCIEALKRMRESERYNKGIFCWIGYKKKEVTFDRENRIEGKSHWNFWSLLNLAIEGITSFSIAPLRLSAILGGIIAFVAFLLMVFYGLKTIIFGDEVRGFTTLIVVILFMGGVQLLTIGILGEYIARIYNESKHRPPYLISEYNGKKVF